MERVIESAGGAAVRPRSAPSTGPACYWLRRHVFVCDAGRYCVFLDLARDRYCSIVSERVPQAAKVLAARGLLTSNPDDGHDWAPAQIPPPMASLLDSTAVGHHAHGSAARDERSVPIFLAACTRAQLTLRFSTIQKTVERVARRKYNHRIAGYEGPPPVFDLERAACAVTGFERLRPWFPRNYRCLFDSLALIEVLAHHGLFPSWVFGVYPEPFEAHCWIQEGSVVLNDRVAHVSAFTPVLVV